MSIDRKKIALLIGQADEEYQHHIIRGITEEAFSNNWDVYVFSMFIKYQNNSEREIGDSSIFQLADVKSFDGIILLFDTILTPGVAASLEERIHNEYDGPVVAIDYESSFFYSFFTDGYKTVYSIISHLIEKHGKKDIAFLTGKKNHRHSERRLEAYRDAMKNHGLTVREDRIGYGDYWYSGGATFAEQLLRNRLDMPEAVAAANDCMAIGAAEKLTAAGLGIPEDIAVTGYGSGPEGCGSPVSLTSGFVPAEEYGAYAVNAIKSLMEKKEIPSFETEEKLFIGHSCGCDEIDMTVSLRRHEWATETSDDGIYSIHNFMLEDMMLENTLEGILNIIYSNIYQLKNIDSYHLCLNKQFIIKEMYSLSDAFDGNLSDVMLHAIEYYNSSPEDNKISISGTFPKSEMLPGGGFTEKPAEYIFTPLYFENRCFGYQIVSFGEASGSYDNIFRIWSGYVSKGLEIFRREMLLKEFTMKEAVVEAAAKLPKSLQHGEHRIRNLSPEERREHLEVGKLLDDNLFDYHFQPIVSARSGEIYAYEALMRSRLPWKIPPLQIIKHADLMGRLVDIEKSTFLNVLNIYSEKADSFKGRKIFINSIPGSRLAEEDYNSVSKLLEDNRGSVVVELTEQAELQNQELDELKKRYASLGIEMAIDDYGTGYSNVTNLLRYMPGYVKIDRYLLTDIQNSPEKQHFVRDIIEFCKSNNIMSLAEGVETSEELATVIRLGADLIQGYYTARPSADIIDEISADLKDEISAVYRAHAEGLDKKVYAAGRTGRININNLSREGVDTIRIGDSDAMHHDFTIVGTPNTRSRSRILVDDGYEGHISLENVFISRRNGNTPIIEIGRNCRVILTITGENIIEGGGILVPESSYLEVLGDGALHINIEAEDCYGIGGPADMVHGGIHFYQDGIIDINMSGNSAVALGSGKGGELEINKGRFILSINSEYGIGVGSISSPSNMNIHNCEMEINLYMNKGVCIGSMEEDADISIWETSLKCYAGGKEVTGLGTVGGKNAVIDIHDASTFENINSDNLTAVGALHGRTSFTHRMASFRTMIAGKNSVTFGAVDGSDTDVVIYNSDVNINQRSEIKKETLGEDARVHILNGRYQVLINDERLIREQEHDTCDITDRG